MFEVEIDSCTNASDVERGGDENSIAILSGVRLKDLDISRQLKLVLLQAARLHNDDRAIHGKKDEKLGEVRAMVIASTQIGVL